MGYWQDREARAQARLTNKSIKQTQDQLVKYYQKSMKSVIGQFEETYNKLLTDIAQGREPTPADLYKLDKYWELQGQLKAELEQLGDKTASILSQNFMKQYKNVYEGISIKGEDYFTHIDTKAAQQMINQVWCADGKSWSDRVWSNTDKLQQALNDNLIQCVVTGKQPSELKKMLMREFNVSYDRANSIVRTEMAHIQTEAARQRYKDYGIEQVQVWGDYDERRCDVCGKLHETKYYVNESLPIPAHPNCRCCIIPVVEI